MSKRKPNNPRARIERYSRAVLRQYRVAVVNIDKGPDSRQGLIDLATGKNVGHGANVAEAVCSIAHPWVIYIGAFCVDKDGRKYVKATEVAPEGIYRSDSLTPVIEKFYRELRDGCNPAHLVGSGWIANPSGVSLDEAHAERIFAACGAWEPLPEVKTLDVPRCHMKPMQLVGQKESQRWECQHCSHTKEILL